MVGSSYNDKRKENNIKKPTDDKIKYSQKTSN